MSRRADYEARLIKSVVLYPEDLLPTFLSQLKEADFQSGMNRRIYRLIDGLTKKIDQIGSTDIIDALEESGIPSTFVLDEKVTYYTKHDISTPIKKVKQRSNLARMQQLHAKWLGETKKADLKVDKHIGDVMAALYQVRIEDQDVTGPGVLKKLYDQWDRYAGKDLYGVELGFEKLDFITMGCQPQHLWLIGGYTSVGKSWLGTRIVNAHLAQDIPVLWLSFEMSAEELWWRLSVQATGSMSTTLKSIKQKSVSDADLMRFENELKKLSEKQIFTIDHLSTWEETRLAINYYVYSQGVKCVVVDYLQNIAAPKVPSEYDRLNMIVRDLQKLAVKNDVFVCAFSQMNRESVREDEEYVFGFKGSGNLENAADIAMIFKSASSDREDPRRKLIIGKNRTGETGTAYFYTNFSYGYIKEVDEQSWKNYTKPSNS